MLEKAREDFRGAQRFLSAAENDGISGLETERGSVDGHVRAAFVNEEDASKRHGDARNFRSVFERALFENLSQRIGEGGYLLDASCHEFDAVMVESQAVELCRGEGRTIRFDILFVFFENLRFVCAERCGDIEKNPIARVRGKGPDVRRGGSRVLGEFRGVVLNVFGSHASNLEI